MCKQKNLVCQFVTNITTSEGIILAKIYTEPVTVGADHATVYICLVSEPDGCKQKTDI